MEFEFADLQPVQENWLRDNAGRMFFVPMLLNLNDFPCFGVPYGELDSDQAVALMGADQLHQSSMESRFHRSTLQTLT